MKFKSWSKHFMLGLLLVFTFGVAACGKDNDTGGDNQETGNPGVENQGTEEKDGKDDKDEKDDVEKVEDNKEENNETEDNEVKKEIVTMADKAYASFSGFLNEYCFESRIIEGMASWTGEELWFWQEAEMNEIVIDAYEHTGDQRYYALMNSLYEGFLTARGEDWEWNEYNDDIAWAIIGSARSYIATGEQRFLDLAVKHFDLVWNRGWSDDLGGGVWWRTDNNTKNACINCPFAIGACLLGDILKDEEYYEKAVRIMDWVVANLYEADGHVYDSYNIEGEKNYWASTYNQGTFIGANTLLYIHYGEREYYTRARKAADYTIQNMYKGGVMNNEENGGDLPGFKGILARWMYHFGMYCGQQDVMDWLRLNAESAWSNRNSDDLMTTQLATKAPEKTGRTSNIIPFSASSAVSVLNNCREEGDEIKISVSDTIDIDLFTRCGKLVISGEKGEARTIETVGSNAYLEYDSVRFSADCTSLRFSMAADQECTVEVRLDAIDGELVATLVVPAGDTLQTVQADIEKISDRHRVYLVIPEEGRRISY